MADIGSEVHITGSEYGPWASEITAIRMAEAISDLVDLTKKQQTNIVNQLKKNGKVSEKTAKELGKGSGLGSSLGKDLKAAGDSALDTAGGFNKLNKGPLKNFGAALKKSSLGFKAGLASFGLLGQAIGKSIAVVRESTAAMRDMADSGITIAGGMRELQDGLADTGMTLAEAAEITGKYSQVVGVNGFRAITQLTKSVNAADNGFMKYGLTTAEATEFTAEYLEQQRLGGVFQMRRAKDQAQAVQDNIERLTAYSKILNVSRKHMMETTTTMKNREDVQARFAAMDTEQRMKANTAFEATVQAFTALGPKGEEFGTMLTDMLGNPVAEASETFRQLAQVSPELAKQMAQASRNVADGIPVTAAQAKSMMQLAAQNKDTLVAMSIMDNEVGTLAKKLLAASLIPEQAAATELKNQKAFEEAKRNNENLTREEFNKSVAGNVQTAASLDDALNVLRATAVAELTKSFLNLVGAEGKGGIEAAIKGIRLLTENISGLSDYARKFRDFFGEGLGGMIKAFSALALISIGGPMTVVGAFKGISGAVTLAGKGIHKFAGFVDGKLFKNMNKMNTNIGKAGGALAAFGVGLAVGTAIYKKYAVGIQDTLAGLFGNEPTAEEITGTPTIVRTPEEQRKHNEEKAARYARIDAAKATASKKGAPTATTPTATEPSMSGADIAKLDVAGQQLYYTKRLVRLVESNGGLMA